MRRTWPEGVTEIASIEEGKPSEPGASEEEDKKNRRAFKTGFLAEPTVIHVVEGVEKLGAHSESHEKAARREEGDPRLSPVGRGKQRVHTTPGQRGRVNLPGQRKQTEGG